MLLDWTLSDTLVKYEGSRTTRFVVTFFSEFLLARPSVRRTMIFLPRGCDSSAIAAPPTIIT
jgi:hypothetical protein